MVGLMKVLLYIVVVSQPHPQMAPVYSHSVREAGSLAECEVEKTAAVKVLAEMTPGAQVIARCETMTHQPF